MMTGLAHIQIAIERKGKKKVIVRGDSSAEQPKLEALRRLWEAEQVFNELVPGTKFLVSVEPG